MHPFLYFTGASDATYPYASAYLSIYLIGTVMVLITVGLTPFILIQGKTWIATLAVVVGAAANIILDPVFIYLFNMGGSRCGAGNRYFSNNERRLCTLVSDFQIGSAAHPAAADAAAC